MNNKEFIHYTTAEGDEKILSPYINLIVLPFFKKENKMFSLLVERDHDGNINVLSCKKDNQSFATDIVSSFIYETFLQSNINIEYLGNLTSSEKKYNNTYYKVYAFDASNLPTLEYDNSKIIELSLYDIAVQGNNTLLLACLIKLLKEQWYDTNRDNNATEQ